MTLKEKLPFICGEIAVGISAIFLAICVDIFALAVISLPAFVLAYLIYID